MSKVLITGANGFIGQHIVAQLLEKKYIVVGTVRSPEKGAKLISRFNNDHLLYEIIANLDAEGGFDSVLQNHPDIKTLIHVASPFRFDYENPESDILIPAVEGTKNLLKAIFKYGPQIERVVITSSDAAASSTSEDPPSVLDETVWNTSTYEEAKSNNFSAYLASNLWQRSMLGTFTMKQSQISSCLLFYLHILLVHSFLRKT